MSCAEWARLRPRLVESREALDVEWPKAIGLVHSRIKARFFDPIEKLRVMEYAGFAILALDCLLIETLEAFRRGRHAASPEESREAFQRLLTESPGFSSYFTPELVTEFYRNVRNGLLHDGETRRGWVIRFGSRHPLIERRPTGLTVVNRELFHGALTNEFHGYLEALGKRTNADRRDRLKSALTDLCDRSMPRPDVGASRGLQ